MARRVKKSNKDQGGSHLNIPESVAVATEENPVSVEAETGDEQDVLARHEEVAEEIGAELKELGEICLDGKSVDLARRPVTEEAFELLRQPVPGAHPLLNYWPLHMQRLVAQALGRQIRADEIKYFVGEDIGGSAKCRVHQAKYERAVAQIQKERDEEIALIGAMDPNLYSDDLKSQEKDRVVVRAQELISEIDIPGNFTPIFWVDPYLQVDEFFRLLEETGDVAQTFMRGDRALAIVRSGCFYQTEESGTVALSGSPWFYDQDMKMVRTATSPLGRMSVQHPATRNEKRDIERYFGKGAEARSIHLKHWWGISRMEMDRRTRLEKLGRGEERRALTCSFIDEILGVSDGPIRQAKPRVGKGACRS